MSASAPVQAQDLLQADSTWIKDAQATLDARIAAAPQTGTARNVILIVGDGSDVATTCATRLCMGQRAGGFGDAFVLPQETFPNVALVKTDPVDAQTADGDGAEYGRQDRRRGDRARFGRRSRGLRDLCRQRTDR